ncbi:MAG: hypothetical protein JXA37_03700 [Chloroflexia bacterium]|nr:hypothetical protein [Chloroflexia bacterium]
MRQFRFSMLLVLGLVSLALVLVACGAEGTPCPSPEPCPPCEECPDCPDCLDCPECPVPEACLKAPFEAEWSGSGHADATAEAFRHWDEDEPVEVPSSCAKCHSAYGYLDFLGIDGTEAGTVDNAAAVDSVISCATCHNEASLAMDSVMMPSGLELTGLGAEARCMQCHQGRESKVSVDTRIADAGATDEDAVTEGLGFVNIHYHPAAATKYGTFALGGYQYDNKTYDGNFAHVEEFDTCFECHSSHSLEVKYDECQECHAGLSADNVYDVRMAGSTMDYDGDGDTSEGIYYELAGLQDLLYTAIQAYGNEVAGTDIVYDGASYPYFFTGDGERYASWTPRLVKAAYNYQLSIKDPGAFAHNGKYMITLLYDSIEELNMALSSPVELSMAHRIDAGHFAGSEEAFRHWDEDGEVSASCAPCHSAAGLPFRAEHGVDIAQEVSNGFLCSTCHTFSEEGIGVLEFATVEFPSGAEIDSGTPAMNLCLNCHQGRESKASIDRATADLDPDTVPETALRFINVHYFAAGATLFGTEAQGAYEYEGQEYLGRFAHVPGFDTCTSCHDKHGLAVEATTCATCHGEIEDVHDIRLAVDDFDGDGDATEGLSGEIETLTGALYAAMQAYAADAVGTGIVYDAHSYPYFFIDTNGNGLTDPDEVDRSNGYASWTPRLLRAAYNYQYVTKDPGAFAHNGKYILQVLYDALVDLDVDVSGMTRP